MARRADAGLPDRRNHRLRATARRSRPVRCSRDGQVPLQSRGRREPIFRGRWRRQSLHPDPPLADHTLQDLRHFSHDSAGRYRDVRDRDRYPKRAHPMERTSTTGRWVSVTAGVIAVAVCLIGPAVTSASAQSDLFVVVDADGVERVSTADGALAKNLVASDPAASQVALSGDGSVTFVAHANSSVVSKIDAAGNLTAIDVGGTPAALAASQTGDVLYVLRPVGGPSGFFNASGEVVAFNLVTKTVSNPVA